MHLYHYRMRVDERNPPSGGEPRPQAPDRLLAAAEHLLARHGVEGASLREITRLAGAKSPVAVQYHFGDRAGLVRAVLRKHRTDVEARRHALLDEHEADPSKGVRFLAACLVRPWAAKLADDDGGRDYLRIHAELLNLPRDGSPDAPVNASESVQRWRDLVEPYLEADATRLHRRFTVMRFAAAELGRRATEEPHADDRLFVSHLVDLVEALLVAATSNETRRLADERDAARRRRR